MRTQIQSPSYTLRFIEPGTLPRYDRMWQVKKSLRAMNPLHVLALGAVAGIVASAALVALVWIGAR